MRGFTLVELLISIAVASVLASSIVIAVNPTRRLKQARDVQRKADIASIMAVLIAYEANNGIYPGEVRCDSSIGSAQTVCPINPPQSNWNPTSYIYKALVDQKYVKSLPVDPINNSNNYYVYEPSSFQETVCPNYDPINGRQDIACRYWIGVKLEAPDNPNEQYFRCSDNEKTGKKPGCIMVAGVPN